MASNFHRSAAVLALGAFLRVTAAAQTSEWQPDSGNVSLGDVARSLRKKTADPAPPTVIDNDNLAKVMDDADGQRQSGRPVFSIDSASNQFRVSSPDGSCSLSFSAEAASLVSTPYAVQDLPDRELAKLDGPATIHDQTLQVSVHNGSSWNLKEITVGLTIVRPDTTASASYYGTAKLISASAGDNSPGDGVQSEKHSDSTVLYHLKGWAPSLGTATFAQTLEIPLDAGQEWHWAIVQARGTPSAPDAVSAPSIPDHSATPTLTATPAVGNQP
jgi:hypothetical protein